MAFIYILLVKSIYLDQSKAWIQPLVNVETNLLIFTSHCLKLPISVTVDSKFSCQINPPPPKQTDDFKGSIENCHPRYNNHNVFYSEMYGF